MVAKVEKIGPSDRGFVHEERGEISDSDMIFDDDDEYWDLDVIIAA